MLSFKEFLLESYDLPESDSEFRDFLFDTTKYGDFIYEWFQGTYMKNTFKDSEENEYIKGILELRKKIPNYQPGSSTLYRIYHERHLLQFLNDKEKTIYQSAETGKEKSEKLSELLKNKQLSLNTGLNKLQSWTGDYENTDRFKKYLNKHDGEYYVTVQSSFTSAEHLFFQPNQQKLGKYMRSLLPLVSARLDAYVKDRKISKYNRTAVESSFADTATQLIESSSGFDNGDESIVDTHLPRSVIVKDVTTF